MSTSKPSTGGRKLYRVQIGAYSVKANADKQLEKAKKAGFKDAFVKYDIYNRGGNDTPRLFFGKDNISP